MYNIKEILEKIKSALLGLAVQNQPVLQNAVIDYIGNAESRLTSLMDYMAQGGSAKFMLDRLSEEKDIMYSQLLSVAQIAKGIAQTAVNNAQDVLLDAIKNILPEETV